MGRKRINRKQIPIVREGLCSMGMLAWYPPYTESEVCEMCKKDGVRCVKDDRVTEKGKRSCLSGETLIKRRKTNEMKASIHNWKEINSSTG